MNKKNGLMKNTLILAASMVVTKIIGALLKIPLANILGGMGMGYFSTAYSLFSPVYAFLAAGLPTVITKQVAQAAACGKFRTVRKIKRASLLISTALGIVGSVFVFAGASPFAKYIANSYESRFAIIAIAPSVFFCCIAAVYKGYYEGLYNMVPTAISQVVESVVKAVLGLALSYGAIVYFQQTGKSFEESLPFGAAAAILGVTVGEICGTLYLFLYSKLRSDGITRAELNSSPKAPRKRIIGKRLLLEALPISIGAVVANLSSFVDLLTLPSGINACVMQNFSYFAVNCPKALDAVSSRDFGTFVYGSYTGIVTSLFMLISSTTALMGKSALPDIASAWGKRNMQEISRNIRILFSGVFVIGLPLCFMLGMIAELVLNLMYSSRQAEIEVSVLPLQILCFGGISLAFSAAIFSVFQAIGKSELPVKLMMLCASMKLIGNLIFTQIPGLSICSAAISTVISHFVICVIGIVALKKTTCVKVGLGALFGRPFAAATAGAVTVYIMYSFVIPTESFSQLLRVCMSVAAGGLVYLIMLALLDRRIVRRFSAKALAKNANMS